MRTSLRAAKPKTIPDASRHMITPTETWAVASELELLIEGIVLPIRFAVEVL